MATEAKVLDSVMSEVKYDHVMMVDDDPILNMLHEKMAESQRFAGKVTVANSAAEALMFFKSASEENIPQILFLDIMMPEMDGFQFLDAFAELGPAITSKCKVVLLSSSESFDHFNRANKNKLVKKFLNKPMTPAMLDAIHI